MTRRNYLLKWFFYTLALIPVVFADQLILGRVSMFGTAPLLFPVAVTVVAVLEGARGGAGYGLGVGILWNACIGGTGFVILLMTLIGFFVGVVARYGISQSFFGAFLSTAAVVGGIDLVRVLVYLFIQAAELPALLKTAGAEVLCTLVFTVPVYYLYRAVFRRVGGDKLAWI